MAAAERATAYAGDMGFSKWALVELVEAAVRSEMTETAAGAYRRLTAMTDPAGTDWALGLAARSRALLSDGGEAEDGYQETIDRLGRTRLRVEQACAHLVHGSGCAGRTAASKPAPSCAPLTRCCTPWAWRPSPNGPGASWPPPARRCARTAEATTTLTAQEAQIARLACDGSTNAEIGAKLFLSVRTVEWHLRKVFIKLGIGSRRELGVPVAVVGGGEEHPRVVVQEHEAHDVDGADVVRAGEVAAERLQERAQALPPRARTGR